MELTQDDVPICRILFNKKTHAMALAMYGDRAREIYSFICGDILKGNDFFEYETGVAFEILRKEPIASFFFDNSLINFSYFCDVDICFIFKWSTIVEKIWDSGELDNYLYKLHGFNIYKILANSPICDKIWDSGKLDPYLYKLHGFNIYRILANSPICDKIWDSGKLGSYFHKMDDDDIFWLLSESPIADKIKASGKIKQKKE